MMMRRHDDERILAEAGEWVARRRSMPIEEARPDPVFEAWLMADPRHGDAYDALSARWEDIGALEELRHLANAHAKPIGWRGRLTRAPRILAAGAAMAAAIVIAIMLAPSFDRPDASYATQIAEIRPVTLPDGTIVTLGARSRIAVEFTEMERRVQLREGEAFFEVTHDAARPFYVIAGDATVRVVGTKFDVRRGEDRVAVSVLEGVVRVSNTSSEAPGNLRTLRAGERVEAREARLFAPQPRLTEVSEVTAAPPGSWRDGWLAYEDARLGDVVADLNRYYGPGVSIARGAGELRITGTFRASEVPKFMDALDRVVPVAVTRNPDASYRASPR